MNFLETITSGTVPKALAIIIGQTGASYRPLGAMMAVYEDRRHLGHVSSGCIEADIVTRSLQAKKPEKVTYGQGSTFKDLTLPCGGGMEILILPNPNMSALSAAHIHLEQRAPTALSVDIESGNIKITQSDTTGLLGNKFVLAMQPEQKFFVFGNGREALCFADMVHGTGYQAELFSTDQSLLSLCSIPAAQQHHLVSPRIPDIKQIDQWSSIVLFFHDHELEEQILRDALQTPAFYIGAQGSFTTHLARVETLKALGETEENIARIHGPIGLIPKVRDPQTLAISVLAEIQKVALEDQT